VALNPEIQAVITADNTIPYGDFVSLIDLVRLSGIKKYALTVAEKPPEP
jgi:biopolymer transport protein ExbD